MITEHAPLAPSSAPQWAYCSGAVMANRDAPDPANERAREGTASHWVGEQCLRDFGKQACSEWTGQTAPNGVVIDEEMCEGAQAWVDDVMETSALHGAPHGFMVEHRVNMPGVHPDNWGTLDTAIWLPEVNTIYLWDYKYGHREVGAFENYQLIDYVVGLAEELPVVQDTKVVMRIVQPFCYHADGIVREWRTTLDALRPHFRRLLEQAAEAMTSPTMTAGRHCRDCAAIARCPTARRAAYSVMSYAAETYDIETLGGPDLAVERLLLAEGLIILKARLEAVEDDLKARVTKGDKTAGLTLQSKQGRLAWNVPVNQAIALGQQFGADLSKAAAVTPTQAIKLIPSELREVFSLCLDNATARPATGLKLVAIDESRAARAFRSK